jgi:sarcosine oxidase subunit alpha
VKGFPAQRYRLERGGIIDRGNPLSFTFDGTRHSGFGGDTLASALLANGVRMVGRSFKYHRPRGIVTAGSDEPNALVELRRGARREPNSKATTVELYNGLLAQSQNRWPSLSFDISAINQLLSPLLGAGFYYKTFMWPAAFWERVYEPFIRRAAGLGRLSGEPDPDVYEKAYAFCDVLVVGAGPAGLMAALAAGRGGARVILCDDDWRVGGRLLSERYDIGGKPGVEWAADIGMQLEGLPDVRVMTRTSVVGSYDGGNYAALERVSDHLAEPPPHQPRQRLWNITAKRVIVAAGALERPIAFGGNDRPGVMLGSAVRTYLNRFAVLPGRRFAVFTNNDDGWRTAADLTAAGQEVCAVIDSRPDDALPPAASAASQVLSDAQVIATRGWHGLKKIVVATATGEKTIIADALAVSGGYNPNIALTCHRGGRPAWNDETATFVPGTFPSEMNIVGAAAGTMSLAMSLAEGARAGGEAARACGGTAAAIDVPRASDEKFAIAPMWHVKGSRGKAFVDLQNDVTVKDVALARQEGFRSVEHLKRYTTLGMATDQGKTSNVTGLAIMAEMSGRSIPQTGTTIFRPPFVPVSIGALAGGARGKHFRPTRLPPSHRFAEAQGAVFVETGPWLRAQWFARTGEKDWLESVDREVRTVRESVGVCDVSTLGKIDIQGPDADVLLDRVYINTFSTLAVGKSRYGVMLREDGFVMDDGTTTRFADDHFYMTTTTANAAKVMQHIEFCHQVLWPDLDVQMTSVSEQWAQYSIAGPKARDLLRTVVDPIFDMSNDTLPYMAARAITVCGGIKARVFRISFSGELAYELAVPARYGEALMRALMRNGSPLGAVPYGTEALSVMRIEKGHPAGNELNGQTTATDIGLAKMMSKKKDYIGRVMAERPALVAADRPRLTGFKPVDRRRRLRAGAHFLPHGADARAENDQGYMTSVAHSPTLGHWIGLGFLFNAATRTGEVVRAYDPVRGEDIDVEVCSPGFVDPNGERLRV